MAHPQRIAITLPVPPDVESTQAYAKWAELEGYDDVWFADLGTIDSLTMAAAVATQTERVRIGLAIVPVYTRTPAVIAASALTLSHLAPGRIVLGLGASSHAMIEGWHGLSFEKPLTRVKETATLLREMLAGEKTAFAGETLRSHGYRMGLAPKAPVPIHLAALRPKMLEMAGEFGDGVVINLFPAEALPKMLEHVAAGAQRAGKTLADREIVCRHQVIVTADKDVTREQLRRHFAPYFATPVYNKFLAWCGYPDVAREIAAGWAEKDRDRTTAALHDELLESMAIFGTMEECQEKIRALGKGGINTHIIACPTPDPYHIRATLETFSPRTFSF
jgi:probable F420-dependent oxidoreductase